MNARKVTQAVAVLALLASTGGSASAAVTKAEIQAKLVEILALKLNVRPDQVLPTAAFIDDLGADSLETVEIVMAIEAEFNLEIPDENAARLLTVGQLTEFVSDALQ